MGFFHLGGWDWIVGFGEDQVSLGVFWGEIMGFWGFGGFGLVLGCFGCGLGSLLGCVGLPLGFMVVGSGLRDLENIR